MMMIVDDFLGTVGVWWPLPWDCFAVVQRGRFMLACFDGRAEQTMRCVVPGYLIFEIGETRKECAFFLLVSRGDASRRCHGHLKRDEMNHERTQHDRQVYGEKDKVPEVLLPLENRNSHGCSRCGYFGWMLGVGVGGCW